MFVQYSFIQPRRDPSLMPGTSSLLANPSTIVAIGLICMVLTSSIFIAA